jgi:hypothetical protein
MGYNIEFCRYRKTYFFDEPSDLSLSNPEDKQFQRGDSALDG